MRTNVPYITKEKCAERLKTIDIPVIDTYLCSGDDKNKIICTIRSGGPITGFAKVDDEPKRILYGVHSLGVACLSDKVYPTVQTDVAYYMTWILDTITP